MSKRHGLIAATAAVVAIAAVVTVALVGLSAASSSPARSAVSGTEHFQSVTTSLSSTAPMIMYGAVVAEGVDHEGVKSDTLKFPGGSFKIDHTERKGTERISQKTCLAQVLNVGTYKLSGGTGKYKGISGHGTYRFTQLFIAKRVKGFCETKLPPVIFEQVITSSGSMSH